MNWKGKAFIQKCISVLPKKLSYETYFRIQRHFGRLKKPFNPISPPSGGISEGVRFLKKIQNAGYTHSDKVFFEIGTGWIALVPLTYWLAGADKIITIDLNPWLRKELIKESVSYIINNQDEIKNVMGEFLNEERLKTLIDFFETKEFDVKEYLKFCHIEYISPGDAARTSLPDNSVDYHTSSAVLEHIPLNELKEIIKEGNRIIKNDGLFIHDIDYSDHYAPIDSGITPLHFLRYSDEEHKKFIHRFHYVNRLRHDDFIDLFKTTGHEFLEIDAHKNKELEEMLKRGEVKLDKRFREKTNEILSITGSWFVTRKNCSKKTTCSAISRNIDTNV